MNILFIGIRGHEDEITSGPQKISNALYNRMSKAYKNVYFFGLLWGNDLAHAQESEHEITAPLRKLAGYIKDKKIDVVYFSRYNTKAALYLFLIKPVYRFKLVYTVHGIRKKERVINETYRFYDAIIEDRILKLSDQIVAVSDGLKDELMKYYPELNINKVTVINNGVSINQIKNIVDVKKVFNIDCSKKVLFTVGTRKIKNIDILIDSFLNNKEVYESSCLLIAGEADTNYAKNIIKKYTNYNNIIFTGIVSADLISNIYEQMDLFIQISSFESFGLSIVESLLHKKHELISEQLPIASCFSTEEVCLFNSNTDCLGELILNCLSQGTRINELGYTKAKYLFNWENIVEKYYQILSDS